MEKKAKRPPVSRLRKRYMARLAGRCVILVLCALLWILRPEEFQILDGMNFFHAPSILHALWGIWVLDMLFQLIPAGKNIALGSHKLFRQWFRPIREKINRETLKQYILSTTKSAYKILILWGLLIAAIVALHFAGVLDKTALFMISASFYVCDLICVLIWCPFRLLLKNRCCTTCRIFNWDHLMMFSPMIFAAGFYSLSLVLMAALVWVVWELAVVLHPERFWEHSNSALQCANCTDKLCTQYCQKLRR